MPRKFRLKLDHPFAPKGTIVEKMEEIYCGMPSYTHDGLDDHNLPYLIFPCSVERDWLEEVKEEEPVCSKEFADWLCNYIDTQELTMEGIKYLLLSHTLKTEE